MRRPLALLALATALGFAPAAQAHRMWLLPSSTSLSGEDAWITVDAAVSNGLFIFEHRPMQLDNVRVTGPDGQAVEMQNASTGKYRSTFDAPLAKPGTYRISSVSDGLSATYTLNGERQRWRGAAGTMSLPAEAKDVKVTHNQRRVEAFATNGAPTTEVLKTTGQGLEMEPVTHPNDLFAGEAATFRLLLDGKPAADVEVTIVPGGSRYRTDSGEMKLRTGADGAFTVTWPEAGFYWLEAEARGGASELAPGAERNASYVATLEALND